MLPSGNALADKVLLELEVFPVVVSQKEPTSSYPGTCTVAASVRRHLTAKVELYGINPDNLLCFDLPKLGFP